MHPDTQHLTELILTAAKEARSERDDTKDADFIRHTLRWPVDCKVGPGLEGAIACQTEIGYVNGARGALVYRGYDIFDLCAYSSFEEVSYLLLQGSLPSASQLKRFKQKLSSYRFLPKTMRMLMRFPIEEMSSMAALRLGSNMMRQIQTYVDRETSRPEPGDAIGADEDSIPMETVPQGKRRAIYEFRGKARRKPKDVSEGLRGSEGLESCYHLIAGMSTITAAVARLRQGHLPIEPKPELSHAANLLYMINGEIPTPEEERVMDVCLILHADHGMNASTFAAMVVASTLSDIYFSIGAGIAALNGPLHGGANEQVMSTLEQIGKPENVERYFEKMRKRKSRIPGFGHRVYKAYDPRARILGPLARYIVQRNEELNPLIKVAETLEHKVISSLGEEKKIFPNVDFYSGLVYRSLGIPPDLFTPLFAVSRVSGWTSRILEYLRRNRIFRPRAVYTGEFGKEYTPLADRD